MSHAVMFHARMYLWMLFVLYIYIYLCDIYVYTLVNFTCSVVGLCNSLSVVYDLCYL